MYYYLRRIELDLVHASHSAWASFSNTDSPLEDWNALVLQHSGCQQYLIMNPFSSSRVYCWHVPATAIIGVAACSLLQETEVERELSFDLLFTDIIYLTFFPDILPTVQFCGVLPCRNEAHSAVEPKPKVQISYKKKRPAERRYLLRWCASALKWQVLRLSWIRIATLVLPVLFLGLQNSVVVLKMRWPALVQYRLCL